MIRVWTSLRRDDRGSTSVELAILFPLLLGVLWLTMSAAMFFYGRTAALSIAQAGATAGAARHASLADCRSAAAELAARVGDALGSLTIDCRRTATTVTTTVTGATLSLVPGWAPTVTQLAVVVVERVT